MNVLHAPTVVVVVDWNNFAQLGALEGLLMEFLWMNQFDRFAKNSE